MIEPRTGIRAEARLRRSSGIAAVAAVVEEKHSVSGPREPARQAGAERAVPAVPVADEHR